MLALTLESLLLMGAAYFVGAACGCLLRRALFARAVPKAMERRVDPLPGVMQAGAGRFGRAASAQPVPPQPQAMRPAPAAGADKPGAARKDDLQRIRAIDAALEGRLNALGVTSYQQIAGWMRADVQRVSRELGSKGRINQENWIEQAQILAKGVDTNYAARRARGETPSATPSADQAGAHPPSPAAVMPQQTDGPHVAERAAFAGTERASPVRAVPDAAVSIRPVPAPERDNLQRISGVDADIEDQLVREGITRYAQIANWSPTDVERFDQHFQPAGRIARENWIEQAQILSRGGDTAYSRQFDRRTSGETGVKPLAVKLGHAIAEQAAKTDREAQSSTVRLEALRSVRSQGLQDPEPGPEAAVRVAATNRVSGGQDDLKRIRGIGVLIEKKLKSMGVASYEQIANWTAQDIDRISQSLDFKGRIERENWVEQARILASGGTTEFSRRVDRGEVETSRYRS